VGADLIRVVIVDEEPAARRRLRATLDSADGIVVVDEASGETGAVRAVVRHLPDVVGIVLRTPGGDGLMAIEQINALREPPAVVVLTTLDADHHLIGALRAGAIGGLPKSAPPDKLFDLVRVAAVGHTVLSPAATKWLVASATERQTTRDHRFALVGELTERETEVLVGLGVGLSNAQIAQRLHLSETTVKSYVSRLLVKLDCANRTQAGLLAFKAGLCPS
jgi:DNA-binding NarL/FixJ family response regulator